MIKKGILIDTSKYEVIREIEYEDKRIDGMFFKVGKDLIPVAYIFPIENRAGVEIQLNALKAAKKEYDDFVAEVYYKIFPTLR